ncbi:hypothetical protein BpHYR1_030455 [Brachionus plicatilis]|uniref:Uncharacterized protein n=1 Tax=Brachionus plicatilis TaxID=10195 RepID=A0A3M7QTG0_BRAPC|nr:hypothetical protein BpHYR1_030455 [Brachionus plicatilis]
MEFTKKSFVKLSNVISRALRPRKGFFFDERTNLEFENRIFSNRSSLLIAFFCNSVLNSVDSRTKSSKAPSEMSTTFSSIIDSNELRFDFI